MPQEQSKVAALSAELETPLNVHRWRKLEGTDPAVYEALLKTQANALGESCCRVPMHVDSRNRGWVAISKCAS